MIQTQENNEKPDFWSDLEPLGPNLGRQFLKLKLVIRHFPKLLCYASFKGKLTSELNLRKWQKT